VSNTTVGKMAKTALWVVVSALIAFFIAQVAKTPELFGPLTPLVNILLVGAKNFVDPKVKNI